MSPNKFELLRHRMFVSLEHMLVFIIFAYLIMAMLYTSIPANHAICIEYL